MPRPVRLLVSILLILGGFTSAQSARAQAPATPKTTSPQAAAEQTRVLQQDQIKPAFRIEPIVHRLEARRGQDLPFEFTIYSLGRPTTMTIKPIAITQRENGVIASDEINVAPPELRIEGPETVPLASGAVYTIKGRVRVPLVNSTFHSFGILVRDEGEVRGVAPVNPRPNEEETRIGVRFVTQYLLRCDINVQGVRSERVKDLLIESVELVEDQGRAKMVTYLVNPTDGPMACTVRCRLQNANTGTVKPPFQVGMQTRSQQSPPEKYDIRILANTRLRLEEFVPHPLTSESMQALVEVINDRRVEGAHSLALQTDLKDYPAQNQELVAVSESITASPGAVEVSLQRGGTRIGSVLLSNDSVKEATLKLSAVNASGQAVDWLRVRPEEIRLGPGQNRKIMLMLAASQEMSSHEYATLRVETVTEQQTIAPFQPVNVAFISRSNAQPELELGQLSWDLSGKTPAFVLPVKNTGGRHLPLNATLTLTNIDGASMTIPAGFGRWILPEQSDSLRFRVKDIPPPGQYQMELVISRGPDQEPIVIREVVEVAASQPAPAPNP